MSGEQELSVENLQPVLTSIFKNMMKLFLEMMPEEERLVLINTGLMAYQELMIEYSQKELTVTDRGIAQGLVMDGQNSDPSRNTAGN